MFHKFPAVSDDRPWTQGALGWTIINFHPSFFELGYEDEFYFSRYFKKKVGVSPQIFRNTIGFDKLTA